MSISRKKAIIKDSWVVIALFVITFIICGFSISKRTGIYLTSDEYSQFAIAAFFTGHDWSAVTSQYGYFSFGYPILLVPFFIVFRNPDTIYKCALILNSLLASCIVPLSYALCKRWGLKSIKDNWVFIPIILFCTLSGAVIAYSSIGWYEVPLIVTSYAITLCFYKLQEKNCKFHWFIIQAVLLVYGYTLHQRFLGILIAGIFIIIIMTISKRIKVSQLTIFIISVIILLIIHTIIKHDIQKNLWLINSGSNPIVNDYGSILPSLFDTFTSRDAFLSTIRVAAGQLFYIGIASFTLIFFAMDKLFRENVTFIKNIKSKKEDFDFTLMFILLAFLFTFAISVLFMRSGSRGDNFIYGRYNNLIYSVLCLYILSNIINGKYKASKSVFVIILCFILLTFWVDDIFHRIYSSLPFLNFSVINFLNVRNHAGSMAFFAALVIALIIGILTLAAQNVKHKIVLTTLTLVCGICLSFTNAFSFIKEIEHSSISLRNINATGVVENIPNDDTPIYFSSFHTDIINPSILQYKLFDRTLKMLHSIDDIKSDDFYLIKSNSDFILPIDSSYNRELLDTTEMYTLYRFSQNLNTNQANVENIDINTYFKTQNGKFSSYGLTSDGKQGFVMYGPYAKLYRGEYVFTIKLSISDIFTQDSIGYIDIYSNQDGELLRFDISNTDFFNNTAEITIPFNADKDIDNFELRVFVEDGIVLTVTDVSVYADFSAYQ